MWLLTAALVLSLVHATPAQGLSIGCKGDGYSDFDFWIGEWEVVTSGGTVAGVNSITREYEGCVIKEQWRGARGVNGSSFNIYDPVTKRWHQTWVDNTGTLLTLDGALTRGEMQLVGKGVSPKGTSANRVTFTPLKNGSVRQLWEASSDDGKTWAVVFDGTYRKRTTSTRNIWEQEYRRRSAESLAAQFEQESRPVFKHRAEIVRLLELRPGMSAAEVGAGSGFLSRLMAKDVGETGRVVATELDPAMVDYMNTRARTEGLRNFTAIQSQPTSSGLAPDSLDAIAIVNTFSFFDHPMEMMTSIAGALRREGLLVIVDFPPTGQKGDPSGVDARAIIRSAATLGLDLLDQRTAIPGHYALRFRKKS